jgi:hypothetical protein
LLNTFTYKSKKSKYNHKVKHKLNSEFLNISVWVLIGDIWYNDAFQITEINKDSIMINLTNRYKVKVSIIALD